MTDSKDMVEITKTLEEFYTSDVYSELDRSISNLINVRKREKQVKDPPPLEGKFNEDLYDRFSSWAFYPEKNILIITASDPIKSEVENSAELNDAIWKLFKLNPVKGKERKIIPDEEKKNRNMTNYIKFNKCFDDSYAIG